MSDLRYAGEKFCIAVNWLATTADYKDALRKVHLELCAVSIDDLPESARDDFFDNEESDVQKRLEAIRRHARKVTFHHSKNTLRGMRKDTYAEIARAICRIDFELQHHLRSQCE